MTSSIQYNRFFGAPENLEILSSTLERQVLLSGLLPQEKERRHEKIEGLLQFCREALENPTDGANFVSGLRKNLLGPYVDRIPQYPVNSIALKIRVHQVMRDLRSVRTSPITRSFVGNEGPTLLINVPSFDQDGNIKGWKSCVMKWVPEREIATHRIYEALSASLESRPFAVPKAVSYNFKTRKHQPVEGETILVDPELNNRIRDNFIRITQKATFPDWVPEDSSLAIYEMVQGENLVDFVSSKYKLLTASQKEQLFRLFGKLAVLDLLLGNWDRFFEMVNYRGEYRLESFGANLGNAMISWDPTSSDQPVLYAIDNVPEEDVISVSGQQAYRNFVEGFLQDPKFVATFAGAIVKSLTKGADESCEEGSREKRKFFQAFKQDITNFSRSQLERGIREMVEEYGNLDINQLNLSMDGTCPWIPALGEGVKA